MVNANLLLKRKPVPTGLKRQAQQVIFYNIFSANELISEVLVCFFFLHFDSTDPKVGKFPKSLHRFVSSKCALRQGAKVSRARRKAERQTDWCGM